MTRSRGFTLVEVLVSLVILATAGVALEQLAVRSLAQLTADVERTRAMLVARSVLADAVTAPPEPGWAEITRDGLRVERDVRRTAHPQLREVHVQVDASGGARVELIEVVRAPQG